MEGVGGLLLIAPAHGFTVAPGRSCRENFRGTVSVSCCSQVLSDLSGVSGGPSVSLVVVWGCVGQATCHNGSFGILYLSNLGFASIVTRHESGGRDALGDGRSRPPDAMRCSVLPVSANAVGRSCVKESVDRRAAE